MHAINDALMTQGSDMRTEFYLFSYWNYFTADRADTISVLSGRKKTIRDLHQTLQYLYGEYNIAI